MDKTLIEKAEEENKQLRLKLEELQEKYEDVIRLHHLHITKYDSERKEFLEFCKADSNICEKIWNNQVIIWGCKSKRELITKAEERKSKIWFERNELEDGIKDVLRRKHTGCNLFKLEETRFIRYKEQDRILCDERLYLSSLIHQNEPKIKSYDVWGIIGVILFVLCILVYTTGKILQEL